MFKVPYSPPGISSCSGKKSSGEEKMGKGKEKECVGGGEGRVRGKKRGKEAREKGRLDFR